LHHRLSTHLVRAFKHIAVMHCFWLSGDRKGEAYIPDGHAIAVLKIISRGISDDVGARPGYRGDVELFQSSCVSAHGRCTAISAGYADHCGIAVLRNLFP
jgi:hypothetical protein